VRAIDIAHARLRTGSNPSHPDGGAGTSSVFHPRVFASPRSAGLIAVIARVTSPTGIPMLPSAPVTCETAWLVRNVVTTPIDAMATTTSTTTARPHPRPPPPLRATVLVSI